MILWLQTDPGLFGTAMHGHQQPVACTVQLPGDYKKQQDSDHQAICAAAPLKIL